MLCRGELKCHDSIFSLICRVRSSTGLAGFMGRSLHQGRGVNSRVTARVLWQRRLIQVELADSEPLWPGPRHAGSLRLHSESAGLGYLPTSSLATVAGA